MAAKAAAPALLIPAVLASLLSAPPPAGAQVAATKGGVFPEVAEVKKEDDAKALLEALAGALATKDEEKIAAAVAPLVTKRHADFVPELKKLLADKRDKVAAAAAEALGSQGDKAVAPQLLRLVTQEERERGFLKLGLTKAAAVEALGRLGVATAFDAVRKAAEPMLQEKEARTTYGKRIVRAAIRYYGLVKEKRAVGFLVENFDQPEPSNPSSGSNPPESYWKARYEIWAEIKAEVVWALKEITGKEFETGRRWKNWLEDEGKKEGMK